MYECMYGEASLGPPGMVMFFSLNSSEQPQTAHSHAICTISEPQHLCALYYIICTLLYNHLYIVHTYILCTMYYILYTLYDILYTIYYICIWSPQPQRRPHTAGGEY